MKTITLFFCTFLFISLYCFGQVNEEGIEEMKHVNNSHNIYLGGGFGAPISGNYTEGFNIILGYHKRFNQVLSIGVYGELNSYQSLRVSVEQTRIADPDSPEDYLIYKVRHEKGGDLLFLNAGASFKLNIIPVEGTFFSPYVVAMPHLFFSNRTAIGGYDEETFYFDGELTNHYKDEWQNFLEMQESGAVRSSSKLGLGLTGGIGFEINPSKRLSFFTQGDATLTTPIEFMTKFQTASDTNAVDWSKFPLGDAVFLHWKGKFGVSYNF